MVQEIACECEERYECKINTQALFSEIKEFFNEQVNAGIYKDIPVRIPFYIGYSKSDAMEWYASKWYKCTVCGCLWEFEYPDFPALGFVRKFSDGIYFERGY